ncbi:MAG TPA: hypothetical protein ENK49_01045 [Gammaproteobacteria bacterium]|nr:hypothetical protein [Gammaproteobacteria bacterium]
MNLGALSLEKAPRFWTPVRFFITAPFFGVLAALIVFMDGGQLFQSRWSMASLAVVHAFTLGYIAMVMLGALFQMLPVVMGAALPQAGRAAAVAHLVMTAGALCLVAAFLRQEPALFVAAIALLVPVLVLFGAAVVVAIFRAGKTLTTGRSVQLAALGLVVTVVMGAWLAAGHAFAVPLDRSFTNDHAAWGFLGWILMLVIGISGQVIPMFLTTPQYPKYAGKGLVYLLVALLGAGSLVPLRELQQLVVVLVSMLMLAWATLTLYLLGKRRRKRFDITDRFWRTGMLCLVLGAGANLYGYFGGTVAGTDISVMTGIFLLYGFAVSVINGMLYKIVPFLVWLNLRMPVVMGKLEPGTKYYTPNIHEVIDVQPMKIQFAFHVAGLLLLVASTLVEGVVAYAAATAVLVSSLLLLANLSHATRLYRKYAGQVIAVR